MSTVVIVGDRGLLVVELNDVESSKLSALRVESTLIRCGYYSRAYLTGKIICAPHSSRQHASLAYARQV